jgi:TetR/AcrR family transcriptional regulator
MVEKESRVQTETILRALISESELYDNPLTAKQRDILVAAEKLFSADGYAETSTASIAKSAGVTEKTLFKHFPSKSDLLRRILFPLLLKVFMPIQIGMVKKIADTDYASFTDFYRALAANRWREAKQLGPRLRLVVVRILQDETLRGQMREFFLCEGWPILAGQVRKFQEKGELRRDIDAQVLARAILTSIMAPAFHRGVLDPTDSSDVTADLDVHTELLMHGIADQRTK